MAPTASPLIYVLLLLMVTAVWGWTFVLVKDAVTQYPTLPFLQIRFAIALLVMSVVVRRLPTRRELQVGAAIGAVLAAGYLAQTVGLTIAIVVTGLFASAFAYFIQTWAQAHISANRTALILATEPAWALVAAIVLAGQRFGLEQAAGAGLLLAAIVGHELASLKFEPSVQPAPP